MQALNSQFTISGKLIPISITEKKKASLGGGGGFHLDAASNSNVSLPPRSMTPLKTTSRGRQGVLLEHSSSNHHRKISESSINCPPDEYVMTRISVYPPHLRKEKFKEDAHS